MNAIVPGSGTVVPETENAALNGPCAVISVPIRSQSGARFSLRIQLAGRAGDSASGLTARRNCRRCSTRPAER